MSLFTQFFVHDSGGSRFLMIVQDGKIWMQTVSKALRLLKRTATISAESSQTSGGWVFQIYKVIF